MVTLGGPGDGHGTAGAPDCEDEEVVEVGLLLSTRQFAAFEAVARGRGLTAAQMLRRLLDGFLLHAERRESGRPS